MNKEIKGLNKMSYTKNDPIVFSTATQKTEADVVMLNLAVRIFIVASKEEADTFSGYMLWLSLIER